MSINAHQIKSAYLAGIFDDGLSTQIAKNGRNGWRIRISKTSQNISLPVTLHEKTGAGLLFQTQRGTRWCIESQREIQQFLQQIEPYVEIRKREIDILLRLCNLSDGDDWRPIVEEWNDLEPD